MVTSYVVNSSRVTTREYLFEISWLALPVIWFLKLFRISLPSSTDDPAVDRLEPFVTEWSQLPSDVQSAWEEDLEFLRDQGFDVSVFHRIRVPSQVTTIFRATLAGPNGNIARLQRRVWTINNQTKVQDTRQFEMEFPQGQRLVTFAGKPDLLAPPHWDISRRKPCPIGELWNEHQRRVADCYYGTPLAIADEEDLQNSIERQHKELIEFHVGRGVFVPGPEIPEPAEESDADADADEAAALTALEQLGSEEVRWSTVIWGVVLSLAVFAAVIAAQGDFTFLWMIIPILVVHEAGHWLAMNLFGYRNMRLFFIPFVGAAVSGRNLNVTGWKKAMVALMGPVPSLVAAIALAVIGIRNEEAWLMELSLLTLVLNLFNLLPVMPLDGGQTLQATLFCRSRFLDVFFRGLGVAGLLILSAALDAKVLLFVGILMAISLPISYKLAKVTEELRDEELPTRSPDGTTIPKPTALAIIARLREAFKTPLPPKAVAQHTLSIFESLNSKPPGGLATVGLLGLYFGSFLVGTVTLGVVILAQHGDLGRLANMMSRQPQTAFACGSVEESPLSDAPRADRTVGFQVPEDEPAETVFAEYRQQFPQAAIVRFGPTIFITLPLEKAGAIDGLFSDVEERGWKVMAYRDTETIPMRLHAIAPDDSTAKTIETELSAYAACPAWLRALPPWSEAWLQSPEKARWQKNRLLLQKVLEIDVEDQMPNSEAHFKAVAEAHRRRDEARAQELNAEWQRRFRTALQSAVAKMKQTYRDDSESLQIINAAEVQLLGSRLQDDEWEDVEFDPDEVLRIGDRERPLFEIGELFGRRPLRAGEDPEEIPLTWPSAWAGYEGLYLEMSVSSPREGREFVRFANWLCRQNCVDIKYEIWGLTIDDDAGLFQ